MSILTFVTGRKLPRSTMIARLRRTAEGCKTSPEAENIAAPLKPSWTSLRLITRLSTLRNSIPLSSIMSISMRSVDKPSSRDSIIRCGLWCRKQAA